MRALLIQYKNLVLLVGLLVILLILSFNIRIVPVGCTGILVRFGRISEQPVQNGRIIFTTPFIEHLYIVDNRQRDFRIRNAIWGVTLDGVAVFANNITITYQILPERSVWLFANASVRQVLTKSIVTSAVKSAIAEVQSVETFNRSKVEPLVLAKLNAALSEKYGEKTVNVCNVVVTDVGFDEDYEEAVKTRSLAAQELLKIDLKNQADLSRAKMRKAIALLEAKAEAEEIMIKAEAEAKANRMIHESLTPDVIVIRKIEAWDGKLPTVLGSSLNSLLSIDID